MATTAFTTSGSSAQGRTTATVMAGLYDPRTGRFDGVLLRRAMVLRGWTADDLSREAGVGRTSVYKALSGSGVRDRTAIKILGALGRCAPVLDLG